MSKIWGPKYGGKYLRRTAIEPKIQRTPGQAEHRKAINPGIRRQGPHPTRSNPAPERRSREVDVSGLVTTCPRSTKIYIAPNHFPPRHRTRGTTNRTLAKELPTHLEAGRSRRLPPRAVLKPPGLGTSGTGLRKPGRSSDPPPVRLTYLVCHRF